MLKGQKILFTGAAGVAGFPIASWLATENEVWGASRLASHESRLCCTDQLEVKLPLFPRAVTRF